MRNNCRTVASGLIFKNCFWSGAAGLVSVIASVVNGFLVPGRLEPLQYGQWQFYLLCASFAGYVQLGWCEGLGLTLGGRGYSKIKNGTYSSQFMLLTLCELLPAAVIFGLAVSFGGGYRLIVQPVALYLLLTIPRIFIFQILLATGRMKCYSLLVMLDRLLFSVLACIIAVKTPSVLLLIWADLAVKAVVLCFSVICCRRVLFGKIRFSRELVKEVFCQLRRGIWLLLAGAAGLLGTGTARLAISIGWGAKQFGEVAFAFSITAMAVSLFNLAGNGMYSYLCRLDPEVRVRLCRKLRAGLTLIIFLGLLCYIPVRQFLLWEFPRYEEGVRWLLLLLPFCLFEGRSTAVVLPCIKADGGERVILRMQLGSALVGILVIVTAGFLHSLPLAVLSLSVAAAFKNWIGERYAGIAGNFAAEVTLCTLLLASEWVGWIPYLAGITVWFIFVEKGNLSSERTSKAFKMCYTEENNGNSERENTNESL